MIPYAVTLLSEPLPPLDTSCLSKRSFGQPLFCIDHLVFHLSMVAHDLCQNRLFCRSVSIIHKNRSTSLQMIQGPFQGSPPCRRAVILYARRAAYQCQIELLKQIAIT
jgi:hypothetical protein